MSSSFRVKVQAQTARKVRENPLFIVTAKLEVSGDLYRLHAHRELCVPGGLREDTPNLYQTVSPPLNWWALASVWTVGKEFAASNETSARITYRFHARDLHLVMAPPTPGRPTRFRVRLNGAAPGADHGVDVDAEGRGSLQEGRRYQLIRQTGAVTDRTLEIEFFGPGVRVYVFTFG